MKIEEVFKLISQKLRDDKNLKLDDCFNILADVTIKDWLGYCCFQKEGYKRNLVVRDDILDCYILCWLPKQITKYHQHPNRGCLYKVLKGNLTEIRGDEHLVDASVITLKKGQTGYIENSEGGHVMFNKTDKPTVSLHFYSPSKYYENKK